MNSAEPKVRFTRDGPLGTVTLASPPLNLIGQQLISDLLAAVDQVEAAQGLRALVLRGEGKVFSAGADVAAKHAVAAAIGNAEQCGLRRTPLRILQSQTPGHSERRNPVERQGIELAVHRRALLQRTHRVRMVVDRSNRGDVADEPRIDGALCARHAAQRERSAGDDDRSSETQHADLLPGSVGMDAGTIRYRTAPWQSAAFGSLSSLRQSAQFVLAQLPHSPEVTAWLVQHRALDASDPPRSA